MKKLIFTLLLSIVLLTACSEEEVLDVITKENGFTEQTVTFDETFTVEYDEGMEAEILISDFQIEQGLSIDEEQNDEYDYYSFNVELTNTGDVEVREANMQHLSFDFYDESGKEIDLPIVLLPEFKEDVFEQANLRPGGVNEGKMVIFAPKGVTPKEMIYEENFMSLLGSDTYRFIIE